MNSRSSQIKSKSCKNWFEKRTLRGTEAEKVEKLSPLFFYTPRNSLVCWAQRRINEYLHVRRRRWYGKATGKTFSC